MQSLEGLFGESPFEQLAKHAAKIHECVALVRPVAEAVLAGDLERLRGLQDEISQKEHEADKIKDHIRDHLPSRYFLPVDRDDMAGFLRQLDRIGDDAEDFAVVATFRRIQLPDALRPAFMRLVDQVILVSENLLGLAEHLAQLQRESFRGAESEKVMERIREICRMEWETDKLSRELARQYYAAPDMDTIAVILLEKLCRALSRIADHAENVGKNLRLMITRR